MQKYVDSPEKVLTEAQNAAVYTVDRPMAVVAGAGSGKTTVLINRCLHIMGGDWSQIDRLLAITFTEKAAGELRARLRPNIPLKDHYRLEGAWIGTFHACCARMIRQHAPTMGIDPQFSILDENASRLLAGNTIKNTLLNMLQSENEDASFLVDAIDFKTAIGALEDLMSFRWHARKALLDPMAKNSEDGVIINTLSKVYDEIENAYRSRLTAMGSLDFQELEIKAIELLKTNDKILLQYRKRFSHILVDEFQDTNDAQTELILTLFDNKINKLCIVGDPRQSIYRFRGANIDCFTETLEKIKRVGGDSIDLLENFRSQPNIVEFVNRCQEKLADGLFGSLTNDKISAKRETMLATRTGDENHPQIIEIPLEMPPKTSVGDRRYKEAEAIAEYINSIVDSEEFGFGDTVCLFQALTGITPYERAFRIAGIPYLVYGGRGLLKRQEISDMVAALSYASDQDDEMAMLGLLRSPLIGVSDDELSIMAGPSGEDFINNVKNDPRCTLLKELSLMAKHLRPSEILKNTLNLTGYEQLCNKLDPSGGMSANIDRFILLAKSIERQEPTPLKGYVDFINELKKRSARLGDPPAAGDTVNAVRCMTVHAAKGLEFPIVVLPDLFRKTRSSGGKWQFTRERGIAFKVKSPDKPLGERNETERYKELHSQEKENQVAESKRLLYVAMTRACDRLVLPIHKDMKSPGPWQEWLYDEIENSAQEGIVNRWSSISDPKQNGTERVKTKEEKHKSILKPFIGYCRDTFTVSQLECYSKCPQQYYLRYVLNLPSENIIKKTDKTLPRNIFGSIVHGVLERSHSHKMDNIDDLIRISCFKNNVLSDTKVSKDVKKIIGEFKKLPIAKELGTGFREMDFEWKVDGSIIIGSIDWLKPISNEHEIIDFKTDRIELDQIEEKAYEYDLQLMCYTLAAEKGMNFKIGATSLIFLEPNKVHTEKVTQRRKEEAELLISNIIDKIKTGNFETENKKTPCFKCPYSHNNMCWKITQNYTTDNLI